MGFYGVDTTTLVQHYSCKRTPTPHIKINQSCLINCMFDDDLALRGAMVSSRSQLMKITRTHMVYRNSQSFERISKRILAIIIFHTEDYPLQSEMFSNHSLLIFLYSTYIFICVSIFIELTVLAPQQTYLSPVPVTLRKIWIRSTSI